MLKNYGFFCAVLTAFLAGCGGSESSSESSPYAGIWHISESDSYMKISSTGQMSAYNCSISNGYVQDAHITGNIQGSQLHFYEDQKPLFVYPLTLEGSQLKLAYGDYQMTLEKQAEIPSTSSGNCVEIVGVSPDQAVDGETTSVTVSFDYRVATSNAVKIEVGYTRDQNGRYWVPDQEALRVTSRGIATASLQLDVSPVLFANGQSFRVHVNMKPETTEGAYRPYASDEVTIGLQPAAG